MRYKRLTKEQILISIDRLTRFKPTKEKYLRVFSDIITSNLIEPKLKKSEIENLSFEEIKKYVETIFNGSLEESADNFLVNQKLRDYEVSIFKNSDDILTLLDNKLNYIEALKFIPQECVVNLKWLVNLAKYPNSRSEREKKCLKFPIEKVLLVEGLTEEVLLPAFSKFLGFDFYKKGIQIIPAGGKNQVVKLYYKLSKDLKIPIFLLLDKDAEENIAQIKPRLRNVDNIHLVSCGEFEDLLPKSLIVKTVNSHFKNFLTIKEEDFIDGVSNAENLENIFKTKGLHEFKKAEFAKLVRENITSSSDISAEIADIVKEISLDNKTLDTKFCS